MGLFSPLLPHIIIVFITTASFRLLSRDGCLIGSPNTLQVCSVTRGVLKAISVTSSMCSGTLGMLSLVLTETSLPSHHPPLLLTTLAEGPFTFLGITQGMDEGVEIEVEIGVGKGVEIGGDIVQDREAGGNLDLLSLVDRGGGLGITHKQKVGHDRALIQMGENQNHRSLGENTRKGTVDLGLC